MTDLGRRKRWVLGIFAGLALLAIIVAITFIFFLGLARVQGDDMLPSLGDEAGVIVRRRAIPTRGDLILFDDHGVARIRRVIGMPGEKLQFEGLVPIVNGQRATYRDLYEVDLYGRRMKVVRETVAGVSHDIIDDPKRQLKNVPPAETGDGYYVMCDFREYGNDSRNYGIIHPADVIGVVWFAWSKGKTVPAAGPEPVEPAEPAPAQ